MIPSTFLPSTLIIFPVSYIFSLVLIIRIYSSLNSLFFFLPLPILLAQFYFCSLAHCSFILKYRFILHGRNSGNTMRFSLRNSQVKITFLCLRSLLVLLLRLSLIRSTAIFPSHTTTTPLKSLRRRMGYFLLEYTLVIYASMIIRFSSFDFLLSRGEIDRVSFPLPQVTRSKFSFFDFTLSYRLDLRRMTFLSARNSLQTRLAATSS